jgi:hypothetical protein
MLAAGVAVVPSAVASPALQTPSPAAGTLAIQHQGPTCVLAEKYFRLSACFTPAEALARGRVYFRGGHQRDWFYVDMTGSAPCLQAVLPRPKKDLGTLEYYVTGLDRSFTESRTRERVVRVVRHEIDCGGPVAPIVESASVIVGSATAAAPAGFITGGGVSTGLVLGVGAAVGGGVAAIVVAGGGEDETSSTTTTTTRPIAPPTTTSTTTTTTTAPPIPTTTTTSTTTTTTTAPPIPTTTTTSTTTTTTTTSTTTTTMPCETTPPDISVLLPSTTAYFGPVPFSVNAADTGSGIKVVRFYMTYCPAGGVCQSRMPAGSASTPSTPPNIYTGSWQRTDGCTLYGDGRFFTFEAVAEDNCGNRTDPKAATVDDIQVNPNGCFRGASPSAKGRATSWLSELGVPGGRGQVVIDGGQAFFPAAGTSAHTASLAPGPHRVEAVLVGARGRPGRWRFRLATLGAVPGSLRVVAGDVAQVGPDEIAFRLQGRAGERVVFTFQTGSAGPP